MGLAIIRYHVSRVYGCSLHDDTMYHVCMVIVVGPPTELLQGYQGEELGVHDCTM